MVDRIRLCGWGLRFATVFAVASVVCSTAICSGAFALNRGSEGTPRCRDYRAPSKAVVPIGYVCATETDAIVRRVSAPGLDLAWQLPDGAVIGTRLRPIYQRFPDWKLETDDLQYDHADFNGAWKACDKAAAHVPRQSQLEEMKETFSFGDAFYKGPFGSLDEVWAADAPAGPFRERFGDLDVISYIASTFGVERANSRARTDFARHYVCVVNRPGHEAPLPAPLVHGVQLPADIRTGRTQTIEISRIGSYNQFEDAGYDRHDVRRIHFPKPSRSFSAVNLPYLRMLTAPIFSRGQQRWLASFLLTPTQLNEIYALLAEVTQDCPLRVLAHMNDEPRWIEGGEGRVHSMTLGCDPSRSVKIHREPWAGQYPFEGIAPAL